MNKTILIADDSPTERNILTSALQKNGYATIAAVDGEEAIEKANESQPNLIILDIVMPKKNGFQVTRHLKTTASTQGIKILLISSKNQDSDKFWGLKQGADEYLTKPFDDQTLLNAVARLI
ncbi:MAG: response regulator [Pyrinomonadaceae bacterium]|nr:response regulator [Pyrinomonadaceae bacterium]